MKIVSKIISVILVIILTIVIIGITLIKTFSSTILNEAYVFRMLKSSNYYNSLYEEVKSNFEKYIGPSGLDESIIEDICTIDDIQKDTETILGNIYEGTDKQIGTEAIKTNLLNRINKALEEMEEEVTPEVQENINQLIDNMGNEYINTLSHTSYEDQINDMFKRANKLLKLAITALSVGAIITLVLLGITNIKSIDRIISNIGIAGISSGIFLVVADYIVNSNVRIQNIKILNDSISTVLQNIITNVLNQISHAGVIIIVLGVAFMLLGNVVKVYRTKE